MTDVDLPSENQQLKHDAHRQLAASQGLAQSVFHDFQKTLDETTDMFLIWIKPRIAQCTEQ